MRAMATGLIAVKSVAVLLTLITLVTLVTFCECLRVKTEYIDSKLRFVASESINRHDDTQYKDCHHLRHTGGYEVSGIYTLHLNSSFPYKVYCMYTEEDTQLLIQRRSDGNVNFVRSLSDYMTGFGTLNGDYWLGLEQIYYLTTSGNNVLKVNMQTWDEQAANVTYTTFRLLDRTFYTLIIGGFSGTVTDDLSFSNGSKFYTYDRPDREK